MTDKPTTGDPTPRCIATKPGLTPGHVRQCPRPQKYGEWCRQHAESLGGWRLASPREARPVPVGDERERLAALIRQHDPNHDTGAGELADRLMVAGVSLTGSGLPPQGTRLVLMSENLLEQIGSRTNDGYAITAEWGERTPQGWYEPTFAVHYDQPLAAALSGESGEPKR
jgi:hypothetical protein